MAKQQISVRIDAEVLERVEVFASDSGMTRAAAIERLVVAGLDGDEHHQNQSASGDAEVVAILKDEVLHLRKTVSELTRAVNQAQQLQAMAETRALPPAEAERVTLGERWRRWWHGV